MTGLLYGIHGAAEKRELARQERIADQLEAEYKKNEELW